VDIQGSCGFLDILDEFVRHIQAFGVAVRQQDPLNTHPLFKPECVRVCIGVWERTSEWGGESISMRERQRESK